MEASRLDRVCIDVAGNIVGISWDERDTLLRKLRAVAGCETIIDGFEAVGASKPLELADEQRLALRVMLEVWEGISELPAGLVCLLAALVRAEPGGA